MPIRFQKMIYRKDLRSNPNTLYVFGDNLKRQGMGGQAAEMRYEPNACGVATKKSPGTSPADYFRDNEIESNTFVFNQDLSRVVDHLKTGGEVVFPTDGLGTGLSLLPKTAPKSYQVLADMINGLCKQYGLVDEAKRKQEHIQELARLSAKKSVGQKMSVYERQRLEDLRELIDDPYEY